MFDWYARRDDDFRTPIVKGLQRTRPLERMRNRVLTDDELARVWIAADGMGVFGRYVQFMLLTATRRNEAARMTYSELSNGDWLIPASRYKNKHDHLIPLSRAAQALLAKAPRIVDTDCVFTTDGKRAIAGFSGLKAKLDAASGVTGYRLHDLRCSSLLADERRWRHPRPCRAVPRPRAPRHSQDLRPLRISQREARGVRALAARIDQIVNPPDGGNVVPLRA